MATQMSPDRQVQRIALALLDLAGDNSKATTRSRRIPARAILADLLEEHAAGDLKPIDLDAAPGDRGENAPHRDGL